jgi:ribonuclease HII
MGMFIGMDEAGYGPNLGPLVVTATAWDVPEDPRDFDFWQAFAQVIDQQVTRDGSRLHVADSKDVYSPARGIKNLEWAVLCALGLLEESPADLNALWEAVSPMTASDRCKEPWFAEGTIDLPNVADRSAIDDMTGRWLRCCQQQEIRLKSIRSDVVLTERFNQTTERSGSKGVTLSEISLKLLTELWDPDTSDRTLIIADKHGGRNRYTGLLVDALDGRMVFETEQGRERSCYRIGQTDIRFQMKAESHFPVAIASMVSKYLRELTMLKFNRFWQQHIADLKPTAGYPVDARRFKKQISETQSALGIEDRILWRER